MWKTARGQKEDHDVGAILERDYILGYQAAVRGDGPWAPYGERCEWRQERTRAWLGGYRDASR